MMRMRLLYQDWLIFSLLFFFMACGERNAKGNKVQYSNPEKKKVAEIAFIREIHNFDTLKGGEIVSFSFVFTNNGSKPFRIKKAETSCGCVTVHYEDKEITPGEKSAVEVIMNTSGEWGNLLKTIEVETSSGEKKVLTIGAYIENEQFNNLLKTEK